MCRLDEARQGERIAFALIFFGILLSKESLEIGSAQAYSRACYLFRSVKTRDAFISLFPKVPGEVAVL
jgi:hypothetical protein